MLALVFGGISAANSLFDLFKKWKERKQKKKDALAGKVESAYARVPRVLKETCDECRRRAGHAFEMGDGKLSVIPEQSSKR